MHEKYCTSGDRDGGPLCRSFPVSSFQRHRPAEVALYTAAESVENTLGLGRSMVCGYQATLTTPGSTRDGFVTHAHAAFSHALAALASLVVEL